MAIHLICSRMLRVTLHCRAYAVLLWPHCTLRNVRWQLYKKATAHITFEHGPLIVFTSLHPYVPPSNTWFLWTKQVFPPQMASQSAQSLFAELIRVTNTDRHTQTMLCQAVCRNSPQLALLANNTHQRVVHVDNNSSSFHMYQNLVINDGTPSM